MTSSNSEAAAEVVQKTSVAGREGVSQQPNLVVPNDHTTSPTQISHHALTAGSDNVTDDSDDWRPPQQLTYIVFKPRNVLSATCDTHGRSTLTCLLRKAGAPLLTGHVGRLDYETSGLMVITTDGRLNRQLRHSVCIYVLT